jgi:protein-S-isoprenylcysteine O-methyltransferase Ste14
MTQPMSIFGIGPRLALVTLPVLAAAIAARYVWPGACTFTGAGATTLAVIGGLLILAGLAVNAASARRMVKAVNDGVLLTDGTYGFCRNPMYASFVWLTIPGLALVLNAWPVLLASATLCAALSAMAGGEERLLEERFGQQYAAYRQRVGLLFPKRAK